VIGYAQSFTDAAKGQELAISQMGSGADIIYHAAGNVGTGVIKAVQNKGAGFYAIGVDKDQDGDAPGRVLTSMVKRVDNAVFDVCKSVADNSFKSGTVTLGLKEGGISLSEMKYTKKDVPADVLKKIGTLKEDIIAGKITPPTTITP
jgi:basic membrane protein A